MQYARCSWMIQVSPGQFKPCQTPARWWSVRKGPLCDRHAIMDPMAKAKQCENKTVKEYIERHMNKWGHCICDYETQVAPHV